MNIGLESLEPVSVSQNDMSFPTSESAEQSAKAEHIQRYLSQVQTHSAENTFQSDIHSCCIVIRVVQSNIHSCSIVIEIGILCISFS
jgi:hypothetical protein